MPRDYRGYIFAIVGCLSLAASPPSQPTKGDQPASEQANSAELARIATVLEKLPESPTPDAGCNAGHDDRSSDLCAQWKAADAALSSAVWTKNTFFAGIAGLVIGGLTLFAAGFAAWYARNAWLETRRGNIVNMRSNARATRRSLASGEETKCALAIAERIAAAAEMNVKETQKIGEAQVRCYLTATTANLWVKPNGDANVKIVVKNTGQSPALAVKWRPTVSTMVINSPNTLRKPGVVLCDAIFEHNIASGNEVEFDYFEVKDVVSGEESRSEHLIVEMIGHVEGRDVFDKPIRIEARFAWILSTPIVRQKWHVQTDSRNVRLQDSA